MGTTRVIEIGTAYSVLQPMFEKVVRTIQSCQTAEQYYASERYIDNFLTYIETEPHLGIYPLGHSRMILASYYGAELRNILVNHSLARSQEGE